MDLLMKENRARRCKTSLSFCTKDHQASLLIEMQTATRPTVNKTQTKVTHQKLASKPTISLHRNKHLKSSQFLIWLTIVALTRLSAVESIKSQEPPDELTLPALENIDLARRLIDPLAAKETSDASYFVIGAEQTSQRQTRQTLPNAQQLVATQDGSSSLEAEDLDANQGSQNFDYHANMPVITKRELAAAIKQATGNVKKLRDSTEVSLFNNQLVMQTGSTSWLASSMFHKATLDSQALNQTNQALISEETTRILARQYKLNGQQITRGLPLISVDQTNLGKLCQRSSRTFNCVAGRYRSLSGHCNNVQNPDWGAAHTPLVRYAPARYADHVSRPIKSARGSSGSSSALPSSRAVSMALYGAWPSNGSSADKASNELPISAQHSHMTTLMSFFGQFIFHDLAYISQYTGFERTLLKCCDVPAGSQHPECMPIEYRASAEAQPNFCLDYVRSTPAIRAGCNLGPRDQLNLVSSYLDGSVIYGSSEEQMRSLRTFVGGRLRSQRGNQQQVASSNNFIELLPQIKLNSSQTEPLDAVWAGAAEDCRLMALMRRKSQAQEAARCFQAGDSRVNENIGLTLMHTIWMREHNYIADKLAQINKHWRDERIFEETRRIVIAELQHITYNEFLPAIIGEEVMQRFNLSIQSQGYFQGYEPQLNAGTSNELASAIFPFILSTIPSALERYSDRLEMVGVTSVADTFMDGSELFKRNRFAQYLMGMISQNAMEPALGLMPAIESEAAPVRRARRSLQSPANGSSASQAARTPPQVDLVALTLQQVRDHGLKSYLYWRQSCQLKPTVKSWQDLGQVMPLGVVSRLQQVYASPGQLELYLALLETPLPGASVGPTFVCLLARQFFHLKHADRYWFENDLPSTSFSPAQLEQIRQTSLAKVMCRNSQSTISFIQPSPMITSDPYLNAYQYCTNRAMSDLELSKWRQPLTTAQQAFDELEMSDKSLARARRFAESNAKLIKQSLHRAKRQLDSFVRDQAANLETAPQANKQHAAHHRYSARLKRQALKINNQSLILELATNDIVRSMLRQGKDREQAQSIQSDIRDFLNSLELVQLDNLLYNSQDSLKLNEFISSAGSAFLSPEQRAFEPLAGGAEPQESNRNAGQRSNSISTDCRDDDRAYPCDHTTPFRTLTGWCNNLNAPHFGQSFTPLERVLPNAYEDGLGEARQFSVAVRPTQPEARAPLPSARLISTRMHEDRSQLHVRYSLALMQFGQFGVDHDLTRTPFSVAPDGSLLDCSPCDSKRTVHRDCQPIEIPDDDAHFNSAKARELTGSGKKCLHFVRSLNGQTALGPRQQINALTAYLDASNIYGSDNCEAKSLRAFQGGRLNSSVYPASPAFPNMQPREILPVTRANPECVTPSGVCFHAGDQRASEQPGLTAMHTVFMRLHNSIVSQLAAINRHWSDEKLYQHARRIVGAINQRITYNEFAPRILGLDYMSKFDLMLKQVGYSNHYDDSCSAGVLTEFAAAAFRMGHSLIRNSFPLLNKQYKQIGKAFQLRKAFFNSQRILTEPNLIDSILRGIVSTPIETLDNAISEELTNHLFERPKEPFSGMDLVSLNIQRARDHGIGGYNNYRAKCNLTRAKTFDDFASEIPEKLVKRLASLYQSVDDVDLFTGGMSELPVHGGIIGPTLGCIIGLQLSRLKRCDRFWHETSDPWLRFSAPQLAEIRKITLAKVICQESDNIEAIQRNAMDVSDHYLNPRVACSSLPALDLSVWRENQKWCLVNKVKLELGQSKRVNPCKSCTCTIEGPVCRTARINCLQVMRQASSVSSIMADKSCLVQCAWALDMPPLAA